jgi:hypothetical protein
MANKTTIIVVSSVLLLGLTTYFVMRASKTMKDTKNKKKSAEDLAKKKEEELKKSVDNTQTTQTTTDGTTPTQTTTTTTQTTPSKTTAPTLNVPIMFGNKGDNVKKLQQLILQYDSTLLPKFKDDGQFGTETSVALNKIIGKGFIQTQADVTKLVDEVRKKTASKVVANMSLAPLGITLFK